MPKGRRDRSVSCDRSRAYPYPCGSSRSKKSSAKNPLENLENSKGWEEARCPICMEPPHNAILLLCSSHTKGCRPFMCDTSYRHSNCFDQFRKSFGEASLAAEPLQEAPMLTSHTPSASVISSDATFTDWHAGRSEEASAAVQVVSCEQLNPKMLCPLCRGEISSWVVVESARCFMNAKFRSCASETCDFSGNYTDLRQHARQIHPLVRPTEADPERQRNWRRIEQRRDLGDLLSTLQPSYTEEGLSEDSSFSFDDGGWLTIFFLVRILRPGNSRSISWSSLPRGQAAVTFRRRRSRRYWEDREANSRNNDNEASDGGSRSWEHHGRAERRSTPEN